MRKIDQRRNLNISQIQKMVDEMHAGNEEVIKKGLSHEGGIVRLNALISVIEKRIKNDDFLPSIKKLKGDNLYLSGYTISEFAYATLDIVWNIKYEGKDEHVYKIIDALKMI